MGSEVDLERLTCSVHADRQAVARCAECGRPTCLSCAVPFKGEVLCTACAARALGERSPVEDPRPVSARRPDALAGVLVVTALLLTIPPWHRFGPLDQPLGAWNPTPDPFPTLAGAFLVGALVVCLMPGLVRIRTLRTQAILYALLVTLGGLAVLRSLLGSPEYVQHTPAPHLMLAVVALAAAVGVVRLSRRRRSPAPPA